MGQEIERKFLVNSNAFLELYDTKRQIIQGYLSTDPDRTVRLRQTFSGDLQFLDITIKGRSSADGLVRAEFEQPWVAAVEEQDMMMSLCLDKIQKIRYEVPFMYSPGGVRVATIEVDVFLGDNDGLIVAEIEFQTISASLEFMKPDWLGREVTGDPKYYNSNLTKHPYTKWSDHEKGIESSGCGMCDSCTCGM